MNDNGLKHRAKALCMYGGAHQRRGNVQHAIGLPSQSIGLYPTAEAYTFRGCAYSLRGRVDDAIQECKKAIAIDPTFGNPYNDIGSYLLEKGQVDEAIEWLEKTKAAPRYEPRHFPYLNLGHIYARKGMGLRAIEEFEAALELQPGEPTCLGMVTQLRGALIRDSRARTAWRTSDDCRGPRRSTPSSNIASDAASSTTPS